MRLVREPAKPVLPKRDALHDIVMQWLDRQAGTTSVRHVRPPGVSQDDYLQAIHELAKQNRVAYLSITNKRYNAPPNEKDFRAATKQSLLNGIQAIQRDDSKGELGSGVGVGLGQLGNQKAYHQANLDTIRQYKRISKQLLP